MRAAFFSYWKNGDHAPNRNFSSLLACITAKQQIFGDYRRKLPEFGVPSYAGNEFEKSFVAFFEFVV